MTTPRQIAANRRNGHKSAGPVTVPGKLAASKNATRHGVLSRELLLPQEKQEEFDALFQSLVGELGAVGTLEIALVERIAIAMWRQRRLVRAERSGIESQADGTGPASSKGFSIRILGRAAADHLPSSELIRATLATPPFVDQLDQVEKEFRLLHLGESLAYPEFGKKFP